MIYTSKLRFEKRVVEISMFLSGTLVVFIGTDYRIYGE